MSTPTIGVKRFSVTPPDEARVAAECGVTSGHVTNAITAERAPGDVAGVGDSEVRLGIGNLCVVCDARF